MASTTKPKITLYLSPGACSLAPHIALREIGASFDVVRLSSRTGLPEDFAKINPKKRVPVLVLEGDGDEPAVITEVPAILTAIAQMKPEMKLLGKSDLEVVRSYEWMNYLSGTLHGQAFGGLWRPQRYVDDEELFKQVRRKGKKTVEEVFEMIESRLEAKTKAKKGEEVYAVGEGYSGVDAYLYVFWRWGCEIGVDMPGRFPRYAASVRGVVEREAVKKALVDEGIEAWVEGRAKI